MLMRVDSQSTLPLLLLRPNATPTESLVNLNYTKNITDEALLAQPIQDNVVVLAELDSASVVDPMMSEKLPFSDPTKKPALDFPKVYRKPDARKRKIEKKPVPIGTDTSEEWKCPNITSTRNLECGCDMPHTLRCSGDIHSLAVGLKNLQLMFFD